MANVWLHFNMDPPAPKVNSHGVYFFFFWWSWVWPKNLSWHRTLGVPSTLSELADRLELVFYSCNNVFFSHEKQALEKWSHNVDCSGFLALYNNIPKTEWLKTTEFYGLTVMESRSLSKLSARSCFLQWF